MDEGSPRHEDLHFSELERAEQPDDLPPERRFRNVQSLLRRALIPSLTASVIAALAASLVLLPSTPTQRPSQRIPAATWRPAPITSFESAPAPRRPRPRADHPRSERRKHRKVIIAVPRRRSTHVASVSAAPTIPVNPSTNEGGRRRRAPSKKAEPPQATLLLRRLYKLKTGDHFHSVYEAELSAKKADGYQLKERIGYLFEERVKGTRLLGIGEGAMGWIHSADRGKKTVPLYHLVGPDYHDHEAIYTSSEEEKDYWIGDGWRVKGIMGYVVKP